LFATSDDSRVDRALGRLAVCGVVAKRFLQPFNKPSAVFTKLVIAGDELDGLFEELRR
jgi:hypothetical protein